MPQNNKIEIRCKREDCYWNLGLEYASNCNRHSVLIDEENCIGFITEEEAKKKLAEVKRCRS